MCVDVDSWESNHKQTKKQTKQNNIYYETNPDV